MQGFPGGQIASDSVGSDMVGGFRDAWRGAIPG